MSGFDFTDEQAARLLADLGLEVAKQDGRVVFVDRVPRQAVPSREETEAALADAAEQAMDEGVWDADIDQALDIVSPAGARFGYGPFTSEDYSTAARWGLNLAGVTAEVEYR